MAIEQTLILCQGRRGRARARRRNLARFERRGYTIAALKLLTVDEARAKRHYAEHEGKPFFGASSSTSRALRSWRWSSKETTRSKAAARRSARPIRSKPRRGRSAATSDRRSAAISCTAATRRKREARDRDLVRAAEIYSRPHDREVAGERRDRVVARRRPAADRTASRARSARFARQPDGRGRRRHELRRGRRSDGAVGCFDRRARSRRTARRRSARYGGKGVQKAVHNVNEMLGPALEGLDATAQREIDEQADRTRRHAEQEQLRRQRDPRRFARTARAAAASLGLPLFRYLGGPSAATLPGADDERHQRRQARGGRAASFKSA
jgi:hypothetical protein